MTIYCDNKAVVDVIDGNKTRDSILGCILRESLMLQAKMNIQLRVLHVMGEANPIANALSRVHMSKCEECIEELCSKGYEQFRVTNEEMGIIVYPVSIH